MGLEIRPAAPEEMQEFGHVASTALLVAPGTLNDLRPEWTLCAFVDGRLASSYGVWPLTMRFNGVGVPVAGVTSVGTSPVYRRRGHLRKIVTTHFKLLHEREEQAIAILYASRAAIYQRYGYAVVSTHHAYDVEPRYLEFCSEIPVPGTLREMGEEEFGLLVELYRRFRADRTGYVHRGRAMWKAGVLAHPPAGGLLRRFAYEEAGEPLGYAVYTIELLPAASRSQRLTVRDLIWLTPSAYRAVWGCFKSMDLVTSIVWPRVPADDPLPHLLLEPRMLHLTAMDGLLGRIVDVERALPQRRYDKEGILTFEVLDDLCPWNRGRWRLETSPEGASVRRTSDEPQLVTPVSTLAMVLFGQISASEALRMGRLQANDKDALSHWDRVMRTNYRPFCADLF